jgi:hypothetical protein
MPPAEWQFRNQDARIKPHSIYPSLQGFHSTGTPTFHMVRSRISLAVEIKAFRTARFHGLAGDSGGAFGDSHHLISFCLDQAGS